MRARRREAMALLACTSTDEIARHLDSFGPLPAYEDVRRPECGMVMARGRIGGDGAPFNCGEATVTRAAVRIETGELGYGYVLGRDQTKARLIALCDAMIQHAALQARLDHHLLAPLRASLATERQVAAEQTAATKVEFFTLVRGEG